MRRILVGSGCLSIAILICWSALPVAAATIASGSVETTKSDGSGCAKSFTSSTGGSVVCLSTGPNGVADAVASATAAFGSLTAYAQTGASGAGAYASSSASYDEMVYVGGGVGSGMLTIVYHAVNEGGTGQLITQGDQFSSICPMFRGSTCTLTSSFVYDVPFKMSASISAGAFSSGPINTPNLSYRQLEIQSAMDQAGHTVTLNIVVPEPGTLLVTGLGLVWAVCLRSNRFQRLRIASAFRSRWWAVRVSNPRPSGCKPDALTN
jgi:hypothetical protein